MLRTVAELTESPLSPCKLFDATGWPSRMCISTNVFSKDEAREDKASKMADSGNRKTLF